jgi:hypothetical protein
MPLANQIAKNATKSQGPKKCRHVVFLAYYVRQTHVVS